MESLELEDTLLCQTGYGNALTGIVIVRWTRVNAFCEDPWEQDLVIPWLADMAAEIVLQGIVV